MNQDYYFPLFGLFATAGKIFLLSEGGGEQSDKADPEKYARQRRGRFLRVICGSMPALAGLEQPVYLCGKMQSPTGRTVRMVGMAAKRGRWEGVNGVCREGRRKGRGVL